MTDHRPHFDNLMLSIIMRADDAMKSQDLDEVGMALSDIASDLASADRAFAHMHDEHVTAQFNEQQKRKLAIQESVASAGATPYLQQGATQ